MSAAKLTSLWSPPDVLRIMLVATLEGQHRGRENGIHVKDLERKTNVAARTLRKLVSDARMDGIAICGKPDSGYYIAQTADELDATLGFLRSRWLRGATIEARLRKLSLPALMGQLQLET